MSDAPAEPIHISVVVCTHNPRLDYLDRTLASIQAQTLPRNLWEFLLIDNASKSPLEQVVDLTWHPRGRVILEPQLGLTPARLRGITDSVGRLIIFVDDDNLLDPTYLETALRLAQEWPNLGVWGARVDPEFEVTPPEWTRKYWLMLAIRQVDQPYWSNIPALHEANPVGAGMCVRREVATAYRQVTLDNKERAALDRRGDSLSSAGDLDLAFVACTCGYGMGVFPDLRLTHLIPGRRLTREYLAKLMEEGTRSNVHLMSHYQKNGTPAIGKFLGLRTWIATRRMAPEDRLIARARIRGFLRGAKEIRATGITR